MPAPEKGRGVRYRGGAIGRIGATSRLWWRFADDLPATDVVFPIVVRDAYYTTQETAKVLGLSERRVRKLVGDGEIEGERSANAWQLYQRSVHDYRDKHGLHETW